MKNIKFLIASLVLIFTINSNAQVYTINQQLKLKTVPLGASSDSVMVVNAAGLVSHIPKSSIGGGGGVLPNLQQVVSQGGEYVSYYNGGVQRLNFFHYDGERDPNLLIRTSNDSLDVNINLAPNTLQFNGTKYNPLDGSDYTESGIRIINGILSFNTNRLGNNRVINFPNPTVSSSINFPNPTVSDTYTLATTADISLQKIVDNNATANKGNSSLQILGGSGAYVYSYSAISNGLSGTSMRNSEISQNATGIALSTASGDTYFNESRVDIGEGSLSFRVKRNNLNSYLNFAEPIFSGGETILAAPSDTRQYVISVAEVFEWNITTAPNKAALDSQYPQAKKGDKINCFDIVGGPMQYEKTLNEWISHPLTVVP